MQSRFDTQKYHFNDDRYAGFENKFLEKNYKKTFSTEELLKIAEIVLENNYFQIDNKMKQFLGTVAGTKFTPPYTCMVLVH